MSSGSALQIVVLAAGKGVRMYSRLPKALHKVCGRSMLERIIRSCVSLDARRIVVVVGYGADIVQQELERISKSPELSHLHLVSVLQQEQCGTGHAAQLALPVLSPDEDILIVPGDIPLLTASTLELLLEAYRRERPALALLTCVHPEPGTLGRIIRDPSGNVQGIVEFRDCSTAELVIREVNPSVYITSRQFLEAALATLEPVNAQGELYLTDIVAYAAHSRLKILAIKTADYKAVSGVNTRYELSQLEKERRQQINRIHMERGVTFEDPDSTCVDEGVNIGADSFIGAGTHLAGETVLEAGVVVEAHCVIRDSVIGNDSVIHFCSHVESAAIGQRCEVGPYARIRLGSVLHECVKVGNFVETKKSELFAGVKANHLSYIGDAQVGENVNIGAGTITCNYDGKLKHQTVIGPESFIGSNTCLVAPVKVGESAYVAAGSTITEDVSSGALAIARAKQAEIDGWVKRRRKSENGPEKKR